MDILSFNRRAWDKQVDEGNMWTVPVSPERVAAARWGEWQVVLTPTRPVPRGWFPGELKGADVLCLASGGGQQGPILAAAGANVTVFDNSPKQLEGDRFVAARDGLAIRTVQGDMADLSVFQDETFDLVLNPVSICFIPDVRPVWKECYRVLRRGGGLITGFVQPQTYCLDQRDGRYFLRFSLPYSDVANLNPEERAWRFGVDSPLEFGHTFTYLIGGQLAAGLHLVDLFEDGDPTEPQMAYFPKFMATRAVKP